MPESVVPTSTGRRLGFRRGAARGAVRSLDHERAYGSDNGWDDDDSGKPINRAARAVKRVALAGFALFVLFYAACVVAMPFVSGAASETRVIDAPVERVWAYGSDSRRAADWSVYFHHITPVEGEGLPADGTIGALRICYRNPDETGVRWTEETLASTPNKWRQIRTFDIEGMPLHFISNRSEFTVDQRYRRISAKQSSLTFSTKVRRTPGLLGALLYPIQKTVFTVSDYDRHTQWTFRVNLENIGAAIEAAQHGRPYERPHPWKPKLWFE